MVFPGVRTLISAMVALAFSTPLVAQEWSAEQKEAWAFEVAYWKASAAGDAAAVTAMTHDSYRGWPYAVSVPGTKESAKESFAHFATTTKTFLHRASPIAILVNGNAAVVHYVVASHGTNEKGEHESSEDRWTDTLVKENGKWMLFADHGGDVSRLAPN